VSNCDSHFDFALVKMNYQQPLQKWGRKKKYEVCYTNRTHLFVSIRWAREKNVL